jgi:hypothetical protein
MATTDMPRLRTQMSCRLNQAGGGPGFLPTGSSGSSLAPLRIRQTSRSPGRTSARQVRAQGGPAAGQTRRGRYRARRPRARPLARRADHQDPPDRRTGAEAARAGHHRRAARRSPAVPDRARPDQRPVPGTGSTDNLQLPGELGLPALPRHRLHHPGKHRPDPAPQEPGQLRSAATGFLRDRLSGTLLRGLRDQPSQAPPCGRHPV